MFYFRAAVLVQPGEKADHVQPGQMVEGEGETSERTISLLTDGGQLNTSEDDVREEMTKLRVPLAILRGGAVEQQSTLRAWQTGVSRACYQIRTFPPST